MAEGAEIWPCSLQQAMRSLLGPASPTARAQRDTPSIRSQVLALSRKIRGADEEDLGLKLRKQQQRLVPPTTKGTSPRVQQRAGRNRRFGKQEEKAFTQRRRRQKGVRALLG